MEDIHMSKIDELYSQLSGLFTEFETNHQTNVNTGNKAAGTRARKALGEVKKLVTEYRKASVEASR
jgi:hypothetical protein|tara:strand:+ start:482 stop:679 length:198 start_codon:yes stop_codon:yes gene_type:complete